MSVKHAFNSLKSDGLDATLVRPSDWNANHTVEDNTITHAMYQNIDTDKLLGRDTAASGDPEEIFVSGGIEFTGTGGIQRSALTGDVTAAAGNNATTIADDTVTNAKAANMAANSIKGNNTGGSADPLDLTAAQATAMLNIVADATKGLAPASGGGTTNFLRADAQWAVPPAGGGVTKAAATTIEAGNDETWLVLANNSGDITGTGLTTVMTVTGVGVGRYKLRVMLIYQTTAISTGIDVAVNHTGTTTQWLMEARRSTTGGSAATAAATNAGASATGNLYESQASLTKNAIIGAGTVSVNAANSDMMETIEGFFVVSVSGDLQIKLAAELASLVCRAMQGSNLQLLKLS